MTLVVDVENHFDISIPNEEAEKIYTVQDFANCVFSKVTNFVLSFPVVLRG